MCGICGFTNDNNLSLLKKMNQTMEHRGPNGEGFYVDETIALGMRRLSVLDVENGNQPFFSNNAKVVVICNGEIYNYKALKRTLTEKGYKFETNCDVEVLPNLYAEYGIKFVELLNGMFAIALYDCNEKKLFLIRDRLGIKPLYYSLTGDKLIFASELKTILVHPEVKLEIDFDALSIYLDLMYIPRPFTPFKSIRKLDSASYLCWHKNQATISRYWSTSVAINTNISEDFFCEKFNDLLHNSVYLQLASDVPLGTLLSGGVDSSLITALAANKTTKKLKTFHLHWKDVEGKIDELQFAQIVANQYGL